jgi:hypothetical protein
MIVLALAAPGWTQKALAAARVPVQEALQTSYVCRRYAPMLDQIFASGGRREAWGEAQRSNHQPVTRRTM